MGFDAGSLAGGAGGAGGGMGYGAAGSSIGGDIGNIIGYFWNQQDRDHAVQSLGDSRNWLESIDGVKADNEKAFSQGGTEFDKLSLDPATREAQLEALSQLRSQWQSNGLDPISKAQIAEAQLASAQHANALNGAVNADAAQRGMMGSGTALAARRANAASAAQSAALQSQAAAAGAQARSSSSLSQYLGGAGQVRDQDYKAAADRATAQDAINRFNTANAQGVQQRNADRRLNANEYDQNVRLGAVNAGIGLNRAYNDQAGVTQAGLAGLGSSMGGLIGSAVGI
jgi:hypothetical protein